jgi:hypothetical protein
MADFLPAWLRELGSIAGLLSLGYVVFDRLFKDRPRASITMGDYGPLVLIANPSSTDVTMIGYRVMPAAYGIARDDGQNSIVAAAAGEQFSATIKAASDASFVLLTRSKDGKKQTEIHRRGAIFIFWRKNSSLWLPQIPIWTSYDVNIIASLRKP